MAPGRLPLVAVPVSVRMQDHLGPALVTCVEVLVGGGGLVQAEFVDTVKLGFAFPPAIRSRSARLYLFTGACPVPMRWPLNHIMPKSIGTLPCASSSPWNFSRRRGPGQEHAHHTDVALATESISPLSVRLASSCPSGSCAW